jgi:hypothetical protein
MADSDKNTGQTAIMTMQKKKKNPQPVDHQEN